jgi:hypothetical protein
VGGEFDEVDEPGGQFRPGVVVVSERDREGRPSAAVETEEVRDQRLGVPPRDPSPFPSPGEGRSQTLRRRLDIEEGQEGVAEVGEDTDVRGEFASDERQVGHERVLKVVGGEVAVGWTFGRDPAAGRGHWIVPVWGAGDPLLRRGQARTRGGGGQ